MVPNYILSEVIILFGSWRHFLIRVGIGLELALDPLDGPDYKSGFWLDLQQFRPDSDLIIEFIYLSDQTQIYF